MTSNLFNKFWPIFDVILNPKKEVVKLRIIEAIRDKSFDIKEERLSKNINTNDKIANKKQQKFKMSHIIGKMDFIQKNKFSEEIFSKKIFLKNFLKNLLEKIEKYTKF